MSMNVNGNNAAQKAHNVKFTPIKAGVRKTDIKDPKLQSIFRQHDINNNGILEENEAFRMNNSLEKLANGGVNQQAVSSTAGQEQQNQFNVSTLMSLVGMLGQASTAIASCVTNSQNQISVTYNPTEAGTLTENFNQESGALESNQLVKDNVTTMNNFTMVEGIENPVKTDTTIVTMDPNNPQNTTPLTVENQSWTLPEGATEPVMTEKTIMDNTTGTETTTHFAEDGQTVLGTTIKKGTLTTELDAQGRTISDSKTLPNDMGEEVTTYEYADGSDKPVKETTTSPLKGTVTKETDGDKETVTTEKDGTKTVDNYENGVKKSQTYTDKNGITYEVEYTASGNTKLKAFGPNGETKGFFVQSGENITKLAKQCGFDSVEEFKATMTNKKGEATTKFNVNNSFEMKGQISAKDAAVFANGRKTMEMNRNQGNAAEVRRQDEIKAKQQEQENTQRLQLEAENAAKKENAQRQGEDIANSLHENMRWARKGADRNGNSSDSRFSNTINKVTPENVTEVLSSYNKISPKESLMEAITDEKTMSTAMRKQSITTLFDNLSARARQAGDSETRIAQFREQFDSIMEAWENPSGVRGRYDASFNYKGFDNLFNGMAEGIESLEGLSTDVKNQIDNMTPQQHIKMVSSSMNRMEAQARESLYAQVNHDGWAGHAVEQIGKIWNSDNTFEKVRTDISDYADIAWDIGKCKSMQEMEAKFEEYFGVEYNPKMIAVYEQAHVDLVRAETHNVIEQEFNSQFKDLLGNSQLKSKGEFYSDGAGGGTWVDTESKEQVYSRTYGQMAKMLGNGDDKAGAEMLNQYFVNNGIDPKTATDDVKYQAMHTLAKDCSSKLHQNTLDATGGKGIESQRNDFKNKYYAAYGTKNDIAKRVTEYNMSQEVGATVLKTGVKVVAVTAVTVATGGTGLAALGATAGTTFASDVVVDSSDRMLSNNGMSSSEFKDIVDNAFLDAGMVVAGGSVSKVLSNASKVVQAAGNFASDVALGAAAEFATTGELTVDGTLVNVGFAGLGAASVMKNPANGAASGVAIVSGRAQAAKGKIRAGMKNAIGTIADASKPTTSGIKNVMNANIEAELQSSGGLNDVLQGSKSGEANTPKITKDMPSIDGIEFDIKCTKQEIKQFEHMLRDCKDPMQMQRIEHKLYQTREMLKKSEERLEKVIKHNQSEYQSALDNQFKNAALGS